MAMQLAENSELLEHDGGQITLRCPPSHASLKSAVAEESIRKALSSRLGMDVKLRFVEGLPAQDTPAQVRQRNEDARQQGAIEALRNDPVVRKLEEHMDARLLEDSVRPL
jgi:DNA polymerase-3 subunit gamma/tau